MARPTHTSVTREAPLFSGLALERGGEALTLAVGVTDRELAAQLTRFEQKRSKLVSESWETLKRASAQASIGAPIRAVAHVGAFSANSGLSSDSYWQSEHSEEL